MGKAWPINEKRWPIEFRDSRSERTWTDGHPAEEYGSKVWSITGDPAVRDAIAERIVRVAPLTRILIPGCGPCIDLQNDLANRIAGVRRILCTDISPEALTVAQRLQSGITRAPAGHGLCEISYEEKDSTNLGYEAEWDAVVIVNSVLSPNDDENRAILRSCGEALRPGGALIGFFPTIFASFERTLLHEPMLGCIDIQKSLYYEAKQEAFQIFYTPTRLRRIIKEAGLKLQSTEIFFFASEVSLRSSHEYYGLKPPADDGSDLDEDLALYELLLVATKAAT